MKKTMIAALAACVLLPAAAQSLNYTPTDREAQQARENVKRDMKLADTMEKAAQARGVRRQGARRKEEAGEKEEERLTRPTRFSAAR
jgi:hypothetical protein